MLSVSFSHWPLEKIMILLRLAGKGCAMLNCNLFAWESLSSKHPLHTCCFQNPAPSPREGASRGERREHKPLHSGLFFQSWSPVSIEASGSKFPSSIMDLDWKERAFPADHADQTPNGRPHRLQCSVLQGF